MTAPPPEIKPHPQGWLDRVRAERAAAQQATLEASHAESRRRAELLAGAANSPAPIGAPSRTAPIGAVLATAARRRDRVQNPKIHAADLPHRLPAWNAGAALARAGRAADRRQPGDPAAPTIMAVVKELNLHRTRTLDPAARPSHRTLAFGTRLCTETIRRVLRFLESHDVVDTVNVMVRATIGGVARVVRGANLYLLTPDQAPPELEAPPAAGGAIGRAIDRGARVVASWASLFGLALRPNGWNVRPLRRPETAAPS